MNWLRQLAYRFLRILPPEQWEEHYRKQADQAAARQQQAMREALTEHMNRAAAYEAAVADGNYRKQAAACAMSGLVAGITKMGDDGIIMNRPKDVAELAILYADTLAEELKARPR